MSVCRRSQLIWNQQLSYGRLFRTLPTELSHILSRSSSANSATQNAQHQTNLINETDQAPGHPTGSTPAQDTLANKPTRRERNRAERSRLDALRERLKNEDNLKVFTQFLDSNDPIAKDGFGSAKSSPDAIIAKRKKPIPYLPADFLDGNRQRVFLETYGCQVRFVILFLSI